MYFYFYFFCFHRRRSLFVSLNVDESPRMFFFFVCVLFYFHLQLLQRNPLHSPVFFFCFFLGGPLCLPAAFAVLPVLGPTRQAGLVWREFQWRSWKFDVGPRFTFKWEFIRRFLKQNVNQKKIKKWMCAVANLPLHSAKFLLAVARRQCLMAPTFGFQCLSGGRGP